MQICIDSWKINEATKKDAYPLPFTDLVLDTVAGHDVYSFLDGHSGCHQLKIAEEDRHLTAFVWIVMAFWIEECP